MRKVLIAQKPKGTKMDDRYSTPILNIAAIGTSSIMELIVDAIAKTPGLYCKLIYSRSFERGQKFAEANGIPEATDNFEAMLNRPDIDIIYIASPNRLHVEQALMAMRHGKHAIIEKPVAVREVDVIELTQTADNHGVFFFEALTTIFMPSYLALKGLIIGLGQLTGAELRYGQYSSKMGEFLAGGAPSNLSKEMQGGALNDMGIYCIFTALDLFGEPEWVNYNAELAHNGVDLYGKLIMRYPFGDVLIEAAKDRDINSGCDIYGKRGAAWQKGPLNAFENCRAKVLNSSVSIDIPEYDNRMVFEMAAFRDAILNNDTAFFNRMAGLSRGAAKVLEEAHRQKG